MTRPRYLGLIVGGLLALATVAPRNAHAQFVGGGFGGGLNNFGGGFGGGFNQFGGGLNQFGGGFNQFGGGFNQFGGGFNQFGGGFNQFGGGFNQFGGGFGGGFSPVGQFLSNNGGFGGPQLMVPPGMLAPQTRNNVGNVMGLIETNAIRGRSVARRRR